MLWKGLSSFGGFTGALIGIVLWKFYEAEQIRKIQLQSAGAVIAVALVVGGGLYAILTKTGAVDGVFGEKALLARLGLSAVAAFMVRQGLLDGIPLYRIRRRTSPTSILAFADLILSVFPIAWIFGRSGCSSVHDHPGALAVKGAFLAVEYPRGFPPDANPDYVAKMFTGPRTSFGPIEFLHGDLPRYDLGLLELTFTIVLAALIALTWHKKVLTGTYIVVTSMAYAPVRFAMDFLRITDGVNADPRYGGFTPAQWECVALFLLSIAMLVYIRSLKARGFDPASLVMAPPDEPAPKPTPEPSSV
jgi:phosphatidylglycerol---prolipoprotein diacylglyceryl transferase